MTGVRVSEHFGIVVRKSSLSKLGVTQQMLLRVMETEDPLDQDEFLISFGPHFGGEAVSEFSKRLEKLGLKYGDDFIDFSDMLPEWCHVYIVESGALATKPNST